MKTEDIEYHADGARLVGWLAVDETLPGKRPGVLVAPEGGGLVDLTKSIAGRLAEAGYVAFAMDYYGDGKPLVDRNEVMPRINAFMAEPSGIRARAAAALAVVAAQPQTDATRLAAIARPLHTPAGNWASTRATPSSVRGSQCTRSSRVRRRSTGSRTGSPTRRSPPSRSSWSASRAR